MKKNYLLFITLTILITSCKKNKKEIDYIILSGEIKNASIDSLRLYDTNSKKIKTIYISKKNTFKDTLVVPTGYYYLYEENSRKPLYLKSGYNLSSLIDYKENESSISFNGIGSDENNYLNQKTEFDKKFKTVEYYKHYLNLEEKVFLTLADSIKLQKASFLKTFYPLDSNFIEYENFSIEYENANFKNNYKRFKGPYLKNNNFKVSSSFPNPYKNIDISNSKLIVHPNFIRAIEGSLRYIMAKNQIEFNLLSYLKTIEKNINHQKVIDELSYSRTEYILQGNNIISSSEYLQFMSMVKNENYREEVDEYYKNSLKLKPGTLSPSFKFNDIHNKIITLEDLKGSLIYIDIWATWCLPCIKEIPDLKILEKELRNKEIHFVSMCFKDSKDSFEKFIKEKQLAGIQLFTPDPNSTFFKEIFLNKIPRHILIDRKGNIIDAYAPSPSDPEIKELILKHL